MVDQFKALEHHAQLKLVQYGTCTLSHDNHGEGCPLLAVQSREWNTDRPSILVTGGVHGYETSGVQGAITFLHSYSSSLQTKYMEQINLLVVPCVSPWSYEYIQRWQADLKDPKIDALPIYVRTLPNKHKRMHLLLLIVQKVKP